MSGYPMKPQVSREPNGDISLFIGGAHKRLPRDMAADLFQQLGEALHTREQGAASTSTAPQAVGADR